MKFLFSHRNFPAQFRHILFELSKNPENEIVFITGTKNDLQIEGVKKFEYVLKREVSADTHRYVRQYEEALNHGIAAAEVAIKLKNSGFVPDVIYAHSWGSSMFFKDIFPETPLLLYCEWYYNSRNSDVDFVNKNPSEDTMALTRARNAQLLIDVTSCDKGITPTNWQKSQYPKEFQDKITVLHDGIDTDYFIPDENAIFKIPDCDLELSKKDKVITYATRGMEPYRGFPQFMIMVDKLLKKRNDFHVVIAGEDRVCYGTKLANTTYKKLMLEKLDIDLTRVHFVGPLPYKDYKKLLQVSSVHVYLTFPFVLSWSMLEAMSMECCVVASKTTPVEEVIKDEYNGLFVDFFNTDELLNKVEFVLDNQEKVTDIKRNARKTIIEKYDLKILLQKHIDILKSMALKNN